MDLQMRGLKAAVTGATKGIGRAIADMLADEGVDLAICARNGVQVRTAAADLRGRGTAVIGTELDVADPAALKGWIDAAAVEFGGLDILICNVSALAVGDTPDSWEKSFRVDVMHTVNAVAAAMPYLEKSRSPSIIIISSVSGFEVDFAAGSYGASKATLIHYAKGLSQQLAGRGIRVNVVSPGNTYIEGGIWNQIEQGNPALFQQTVAANPTGKLGSAAEVAYGVVFLASPVASRISGTNLIIDGALTRAV